MTQSSTELSKANQAGMDAAIKESLSALIDNEASEMEVRRLLKLAETDPEVRAAWRRYQLIGAAAKRDLDGDPRIDLSDRIRSAIDDEPALGGGETTSKSPGVWRSVRNGMGKAAIAASVTVAFILGVQQVGTLSQAPTEVVSGSDQSQSLSDPVEVSLGAPAGFEMPPFAARAVSGGNGASSPSPSQHYLPSTVVNDAQLQNSRELQDLLNQLLIRHADRASASGSMGMLPFARVSTLEAAEE